MPRFCLNLAASPRAEVPPREALTDPDARSKDRLSVRRGEKKIEKHVGVYRPFKRLKGVTSIYGWFIRENPIKMDIFVNS